MALACAKASPSSRSSTSWNGGGKSNVRRRDGRPGLGISTVTGHGGARAQLANFLAPDYNPSPPRLIAGWPALGQHLAQQMTNQKPSPPMPAGSILLCSCEDSMPLDAAAVERGCRGAR